MNVRYVALLAALVFADLPAIVFAQTPCTGIHVKILDIRNNTGTIDCALFESTAGFPADFLHSATNVMITTIRQSQARCDFECIPQGTYALVVIHDENRNGKLDTNTLGIPKEGYGFSNDATSWFGPPSYSDASFPYDGQNVDLTMRLHY